MAKVTGPAGPQGSQPAVAPETAGKAEQATTPASSTVAKPVDDGFSRAASGLLGYKSSPLGSGDMKILDDGVMFAPHLLDSKDARNDPKYLRLLAAVLGLDDLERHFFTLEGEEQEEYWEHKAEQRERKLAKVEEEKEERRRQREEGDAEDEESSEEDEE